MQTLSELKIENEKRITAHLKECLVFFAFSNEQFLENKTPLQEGDKYVRILGGGFIPKSKLAQFEEGMNAAEQWYKEAVKAEKLRDENILYELINHECFYTGSIETALERLGEDYTEQEVRVVFARNREKYA